MKYGYVIKLISCWLPISTLLIGCAETIADQGLDPKARVEITIKGYTQFPVTGATVRLYKNDATVYDEASAIASAQTDSSGKVLFRNLESDTYYWTAFWEGQTSRGGVDSTQGVVKVGALSSFETVISDTLPNSILLAGTDSKAWQIAALQVLRSNVAPFDSLAAMNSCMRDDMYLFSVTGNAFAQMAGNMACDSVGQDNTSRTWRLIDEDKQLQIRHNSQTENYRIRNLSRKTLIAEKPILYRDSAATLLITWKANQLEQ